MGNSDICMSVHHTTVPRCKASYKFAHPDLAADGTLKTLLVPPYPLVRRLVILNKVGIVPDFTQ